MRSEQFQVDTSHRTVVDLTDRVAAFLAAQDEGLVNVFVPHATAGLAVVETGSDSDDDLVDALRRLLPRDDRYLHRHGSAGHGADHLVPALMSPSLNVPVQQGRLLLGTWQRIVLVDLNADNPRRSVRLSLLSG
ncbi:MAG: YjbQ family protein [Candidatus Dormibacteraeota bacterium]|nr:YjbQ family protein [Candidatus Dormibacteraeota bacterium]